MSHGGRDTSSYDAVLRQISEQTGLVFREDQRLTTESGIQRAMKRLNIVDLRRLALALRHDASTMQALMDELTIGETYFFRESSHYDFVREQFFPERLQQPGTIRMWSAGCASGEEAYSLAILCDELDVSDRVHILATDVSPAALAKAKAALYREWSLRGSGVSRVQRYLVSAGDDYKLAPRIRQKVHFALLNLVDESNLAASPAQAMDLIFCRNVLIYFDHATVASVARRLYDALLPGGWLVTASGDPLLNDMTGFDSVSTRYGVIYRRPTTEPPPIEAFTPERLTSPMPAPVPLSYPESTHVSAARDPARMPFNFISASDALATGDYLAVVRETESHLDQPAACLLYVEAIACRDTAKALKLCEELASRHSLTPELHHLHGVLLVDASRPRDAVEALRRALFLDPSLASVHLLVATLLKQEGAFLSARRHLENVRDLCRTLSQDAIVPLSDDQTARELHAAATTMLAEVGNRIEER